MSNFVLNNTSLPASKLDVNIVPVGANPASYVQANDVNTMLSALSDLRGQLTNANLFGVAPQSVRPTLPSAATQFLWARSSDNHLLYYNGVTDVDLSSGGTGITWPLTNGSLTNTYTSAVSDGGGVNAHVFNTSNNIVSGHLISVRNNNTELWNVDNAGSIHATSSSVGMQVISGSGSLKINDSIGAQLVWGSNSVTVDGSNVTLSAASGKIISAGGQQWHRTATATNYSILVSDAIVGVTSTASARTITLPSPSTVGAGWKCTVQDESGACATHNISVAPNALENINGANTAEALATNWGALEFYTDGTNWFSKISAGGGGGGVTSVATDSTLTGGPITTTGTLGINLSHANTWSGAQTFGTAAAIFSAGITASGSATNDFSGSTGTFKTSTGAGTIVSTAAITVTAGAASTWSTSSGALTITSAAACTSSTGAGLLSLVGAGGTSHTSGLPNGSTQHHIFNTTNNIIGSDHLISVQMSGTELWYVDKSGFINATNAASGIQVLAGNSCLNLNTSSGASLGYTGYTQALFDSANISLTATSVRPNTDLSPTLGDSTHRWKQAWSARYITVSQTLAFSATPAFDPTAGNLIHIGTITANVTGPTMVAGSPGERCTIIFQKDGTAGTYTIAGWGSNTRTAGTLTFGATASTCFTINFIWDDHLSTPQWVETSRTGPI